MDTFLHAKDAASTKEAILILCEDTDVFTLAIAKANIISVPIYQKRHPEQDKVHQYY